MPPSPGDGCAPLVDVHRIREDFPVLHQRVGGKPLVYLDNAASSQKPAAVIDRLAAYYRTEHSNVHRGAHLLSQRATDAYEQARARIARYVGALHPHEIIFTRGTTEAINLVATSYGRSTLAEGDEIVVTGMEHHSNMVPWHLLCQEKGTRLRILPVDRNGRLQEEALEEVVGEKTRLVALVHISNSLGTVNPVRRIVEYAHRYNIPVLVDGAQAAPHMQIDVQDLDCDFYCFSGHKVFGPTGIGVLYGKERLLESMPPYQGGGDMIETVSYQRSTFAELPHKFEAGTPHIGGVLGLEAALDYVEGIGFAAIARHEKGLLDRAHERLDAIPGVRIIGTAPRKASVVSFVLSGAATYDVGRLLDEDGVAVRTGHHCTMPLMRHLGLSGTVRASMALYNTAEEVDTFAEALGRVAQRLRPARARSRAPGQSSGSGIAARKRELQEEFGLFDDADSRCEYLMELGEGLAPFPDKWRNEAHRVHGCLSTVWLHTECRSGRLYCKADSDALITKGMIAVLVRLVQGQQAAAVAEADLESIMSEIGMQSMITARRKNGLLSMIKRIRREASAHAKSVLAA